MSNVNLFLLATTLGLGYALYRKSTGPAVSSQQTSSSSSAAKKSKKKKKGAASAGAQQAEPISTPPSLETKSDVELQGRQHASLESSEVIRVNGQPNGGVKKTKGAKAAQQKQQQKQGAKQTNSVNRVTAAEALGRTSDEEDSDEAEIAPLSSKAAQVPEPAAWTNDGLRKKLQSGTEAFHAQLKDMRDEEVDPTPHYSHVARIPAPAAKEPRSVRLTQADRDDGWESVSGTSASRSRGQPNGKSAGGGSSFASIASNNPFAALPTEVSTAKVKSGAPSSASAPAARSTASSWTVAGGNAKARSAAAAAAASEPSKKQRQNAAKNAAKKAAKEDEERARLDKLAKYRKEQEKEKIRNIPLPSANGRKAGSAKVPTAKASVSETGALIWD